MVRSHISIAACALFAAFTSSACDSSATTPNVVENVSYVTNVYTSGACSGPGTSVVVATPVHVGIPSCDAYFAETESCVRSITTDAAAIAHFEGTVEAARAEAIRAEASGDADEIAHAATACEAAADAYRMAPCG